MPDILPSHAPSPRCALYWDGTAYRPGLIDDHGRFQVRGEDQLFSFKDGLANERSAVISGADGYINSNAVPAGTVWVVTNLCAVDDDTATTKHYFMVVRGGVEYAIGEAIAAFADGDRSFFKCELYLTAGDFIRVSFDGSLVGDTCYVTLLGYAMTREP